MVMMTVVMNRMKKDVVSHQLIFSYELQTDSSIVF